MKTTKIKAKQITCDATNNPPSTCDETLNIRIEVQFRDQFTEHFIVDLPVDLRELRDGTLKLVPAVYRGSR